MFFYFVLHRTLVTWIYRRTNAEIASIRTIGLCWIYFVFTTKPLLPARGRYRRLHAQSLVVSPAADKQNLHTPHTKISDNTISDIKKKTPDDRAFGAYGTENGVWFLKTSSCVPNESFRLSYNEHYKYVGYSSSYVCVENSWGNHFLRLRHGVNS